MATVLYVDPGDEIGDLIHAVRETGDSSIALVLPPHARVFQSPLHLRLLRRFAQGSGQQASIVSGDPRVQELSREAGFPTYASIQAYERGIEIVRPHPDAGGDGAGAAGVARPAAVPSWRDAVPAAAPAGPAARAGASNWERYRPYYVAAIALGVIGLLLFLIVAPSAKVTVTVAASPHNVTPTIQGNTDPNQARQADHILTQLVAADAGGGFDANPTGTKTVPAAAATTTIVFKTDLPSGASFPVLSKGEEFDTADNPPIKFVVSQDTPVTIPPPAPPDRYGQVSNPVPVQAAAPGAAGNVPVNRITQWPHNPCIPDPTNPGKPNFCAPSDILVSNPQAATGGTDAKTFPIVSDDDLSRFRAQVDTLKKQGGDQVNQLLAAKAGGRQVAVDPGGGGKSITSDVSPRLPKAGDQYSTTRITVTVHGKATVYNPDDVHRVVDTDLAALVPQGETLAAETETISNLSVTQASDDGSVVLAVTASGFSKPMLNLEGLKNSLTGKTPDDARRLLQHRIGSRVERIDISQKPFGLFFLPFFSSRIELDENVKAAEKTAG